MSSIRSLNKRKNEFPCGKNFFDRVEHAKACEVTITLLGKSDIKPVRGRKDAIKGEDE